MKNYLIACLLGIALTFAFAPYEIFPLAVLAPAGLLWLWLQVSPSPQRAFKLGYAFGLGLFGAGIYWIYISIHQFGGVPSALAVVFTLGLIAFLACYPAVTGYLFQYYFPSNNRTKILCAFPATWVASEWIRGWLLTGFPWLFLGFSQTNSPLRGYAPILSVYGVSFMLVLSSALLVNAYLQYKDRAMHSLYRNLIGLLVIWVFGGLVSLIPWTKPQGEPISVALVQGNIPQSIKWSPEHLQTSLDTYTNLTQPLWGKKKLIIWPEAAIPIPLQNAEGFINALDEKALSSGSNLIVGIPIQNPNGYGYYNAVATLGKDKKTYLKRHLVPFGEYTPLSDIFSKALQFMKIPMSEMVPGQPYQDPLVIDGVKIFASICYEIAFPELTRFYDKSIGLILVITNDAWFGNSNAEPQHLQMAQMRALELARPVLFVSNDGVTAIIDTFGRVTASTPQKQTLVLNGSVQPVYGMTPWMRNGTDPILFILICLFYCSVRAQKREAKLAETQKTINQNELQHNNLNI